VNATALHVVADERAEWLEWRRGGIGASDAAAVAGFSPFDTPTSIYLKKIGFLREDTGEEEDWQRAGRLLEPVTARWFEEVTGYEVRMPQLQVVHPERPWQRATLDGVVYVDGEPAGPFESKSTTRWNGEWGTDPPDYYQAQVLHQMITTGASRGWLAALVDGRSLRWWEIERTDLDADLLTSVEEAFWLRVVKRRPPPVDGSERTNEALSSVYGPRPHPGIELLPAGKALVDEYRAARDARLAAEKAEAAAQNKVLALLEGAEVATFEGRPALKWSVIDRTTDDHAAVQPVIDYWYGGTPTKKTTHRRLWLPKPAKETAS